MTTNMFCGSGGTYGFLVLGSCWVMLIGSLIEILIMMKKYSPELTLTVLKHLSWRGKLFLGIFHFQVLQENTTENRLEVLKGLSYARGLILFTFASICIAMGLRGMLRDITYAETRFELGFYLFWLILSVLTILHALHYAYQVKLMFENFEPDL